MKDRINLTDDQIRRITMQIRSLSEKERDAVRKLMDRLQTYGIGRQELHQELYKLRKEQGISDVDMRAIEEALFEV